MVAAVFRQAIRPASRRASRPDYTPALTAGEPNNGSLRRGRRPAIVSAGGSKVAGFRDDTGRLHAVATSCTHLACQVVWNGAERTWDCPCHGSRFDVDGEVVNGPAVKPLPARSTAAD